MNLWTQALKEGAIAGSIASVLSTLVLAAAGRRQAGSAFAPTNASSQWVRGRKALRAQQLDLRHTATGYAVHHGAAIFWGALYARAWGHRREAKQVPQAIAGAIATSAIACFVDFRLTPQRLTPGFEHRLSRGALLGVYAAFAVGLAAGAIALGKAEERRVRELLEQGRS